MKKQKTWLAVLILVSIVGALSPLVIGKAHVIDGDTLKVETIFGEKRIRLFGIDAVEKKQYCYRKLNHKPWPCGQEATRFLKTIAENKPVFCWSVDKDRYGRLVAVCYLGSKSLNAMMVEEGWAMDYARYSHGVYQSAQKEAQEQHKGIWSSTFEKPAAYRLERR
jgi:endonuclease YncB( thermonuclease family)